jgi:pimeloyl-ACP methyl ester carboxylesterase
MTTMSLRIGLASTLTFVLAAYSSASRASGGNNAFSCQPSPAHPDPVVLLHGGFANNSEDINLLQSDLATLGYCTFSLTYGTILGFPLVGGIGPTAQSGTQITEFINQVLAATGAARVDIVGHSTGGFMALYVAKLDGIANEIHRIVAIAPPTHGLSYDGSLTLAGDVIGPAELAQLEAGSNNIVGNLNVGTAPVHQLDTGPIAQPGIVYTVIASRTDEIVTPTESAFVEEPGVTNEYVQDFCPLDPVGHIGEAYDNNVWQLVTSALDPTTAAPIATCAVGLPF